MMMGRSTYISLFDRNGALGTALRKLRLDVRFCGQAWSSPSSTYTDSAAEISWHLDVKSAYLNRELEEEIYINQCEDFSALGLLRLGKSLSLLTLSGKVWGFEAAAFLRELEFNSGSVATCLYYILLHVDN